MDNFDQLLKIKTEGRDEVDLNPKFHPYEATEYSVLELISKTNLIGKNNTLVDFGSGKGRVPIFLTYQTKCKSIGVEYSKRLIEKALENRLNLTFKDKIQFVNVNAIDFKIENFMDRFYFFNPFDIETFKIVSSNIINSYKEYKRDTILFFYYANNDYRLYLENNNNYQLIDKIIVGNDDINSFDNILIYKII